MTTPPPAPAPASLRADLRRVALVALGAALLLLPLGLLAAQPPRRAQATVFGLGESVALLLEGAGGGRVLVGGGAGQADLPATLARHLRPWDCQIDLLIVADRRDLPGATELARRGVARAVATVGLADQRAAAPALAALRDACAARRIPLREVVAAERLAIGRGDALALTVAPPADPAEPPRLRLRLGPLDATYPGAAADPTSGVILQRASADGYHLALDGPARLIVAPAPPTGTPAADAPGRYLLLLPPGDRATLIADGPTLRLRGARLTPLNLLAGRP